MPHASTTEPDASPLPVRDAALRLNDFYEVYEKPDPKRVREESSRCMNCGAAFCMPEGGYLDNGSQPAGCPISNKIPEWNRLVETGRWRDAYDRLAITNNFPEFTARVCPAPCQDSCIVGIHARPVGIKSVERAIIDRAFEEGWVQPRKPRQETGKRIAVVGSGPAGLAAADQLRAAGHRVSVYERSDTPGGLLTYGIPSMKLDKSVVARRVALMQEAGIVFETCADVGGVVDASRIHADHDATLVSVGALAGRDLYLPGRELAGITLAMPYLEASTRNRIRREPLPAVFDAEGKHVVIIGGGDTGADCIATALRQGAASVTNVTRRVAPPSERPANAPWPGPAHTYTLDYAHAEGLARDGGDPRRFGVKPLAYIPDAQNRRVTGLLVEQSLEDGTQAQQQLRADMVVLAIGFTGSDTPDLLRALNLQGPQDQTAAEARGVFLAGDARRGPSLVVHAIAEGREAADRINAFLKDRTAVAG
ncbi:MAG: glutamate synthase subunit beta [Planctomycetota bacterium]